MAKTSKGDKGGSASNSKGLAGQAEDAGNPDAAPKLSENLKIRGEKSVRPTKQTVPLKPSQETEEAHEPIPAEAVDRREEVAGSDETRRVTGPEGNGCGGSGDTRGRQMDQKK